MCIVLCFVALCYVLYDLIHALWSDVNSFLYISKYEKLEHKVSSGHLKRLKISQFTSLITVL